MMVVINSWTVLTQILSGVQFITDEAVNYLINAPLNSGYNFNIVFSKMALSPRTQAASY